MERNDHINDEKELLQRLAGGSVAAFDALYHRYYEPVRANILKIIRDESIADDLLQEVFISLWEKRGRLAESGKVSGWLFVVSYNRSMNWLRRRATERTHRLSLNNMKPYTEDPEEAMLQEQQYRLLEDAIEQLPPQRRRVFELCRFGGMTYEQTARELSISKNTVKDHLTRASESIQAYMQGHASQSQRMASFLFFIATAVNNLS